MHRTTLSILAGVSLGSAALAQGAGRLQPAAGYTRSVVYEVGTGSFHAASEALSSGGVIYDNTCGAGQFYNLSSGDVLVDHGQVPSTGNPEVAGCQDQYQVTAFTFSYCTDQPTVDVELAFYTLHQSCTALAVSPDAVFAVTGLPGSSSALACWNMTIDLSGTSLVFTLAGDGDGVYDGVPGLDTFAFRFEVTNVTGTVGPLIGGDPIRLGAGCDFGVGTVFAFPNLTGSPAGTGYGCPDKLDLTVGGPSGAFAGCFDLGGWPQADWAGLALELRSDNAGCSSDPVASFCFGDGSSGPCPCGNQSAPGAQEGCLSTAGTGSHLRGADATGTSVAAADLRLLVTGLPVTNGGMFLVSESSNSGTPVYDGISCVGGGLRLDAGFETSPGQRLSGDLITEGNNASPGYFSAGSTYHFQYWTRDISAGPSPCGTAANFSSAGSVLLTP